MTLVAMADLMLGRGGVLWIAARWADGAGHTLRAIEEHGPDALLGVTPALDAALEESPARRARGSSLGRWP